MATFRWGRRSYHRPANRSKLNVRWQNVRSTHGTRNFWIAACRGVSYYQIQMNSILTYRGLIYPWQCDHMGHMNVMWYTGKFDEASWALLSKLGLTQARLQEMKRAMAAVQQNITYKRELYAGDVV